MSVRGTVERDRRHWKRREKRSEAAGRPEVWGYEGRSARPKAEPGRLPINVCN